MESALSTVVERVMNFVLDQSVRHVAYIVRYGQNVDELYHNVKDLGLEKERIDHQRDEAEKNLHRTEGTVKEWFQKVDEFETTVEKFRNDEAHCYGGSNTKQVPPKHSESRITTPRLQHILKTDKGEKDVRWQLEGDLNATIQNVFQYKISANASCVSRLELDCDPLLQRIWHGSLPIPDLCFSNLTP
ncbi:hypothetical protein JHK87_004837 [Glycine soja]|nr:hypothetical protein JHK87_004837 [Glycine soja]